MSRKKKVQLIAIAFLLIAVFLFLPNTEWNKNTSILGFISLVSGTSGSIISIFIPSNYTYRFAEKNWLINENGGYKLIILSKAHGLGNSPQVQTFETNENSYYEIGVGHTLDMKGNVTIEANHRFSGKVILT